MNSAPLALSAPGGYQQAPAPVFGGVQQQQQYQQAPVAGMLSTLLN